jgi:hypothetical protein
MTRLLTRLPRTLVLSFLFWRVFCPNGINYGPFTTAEGCTDQLTYLGHTCPIPRLTFPSVEWRDRFRQSCGKDNGLSCVCGPYFVTDPQPIAVAPRGPE